MKRTLAATLVAGLLAAAGYAQDPAAEKPKVDAPAAAPAPELKDLKQKVSYLIGQSIASNLKTQGTEFEFDTLVRGIRDGIQGTSALTKTQTDEVTASFRQQAITKQRAAQAKATLDRMAPADRAAADKNRKDGEAFLAANAKKEGVVALPSGLQYKVIKDGTGPVPKSSDTITAHYRGTLTDGTEFESSYKSGKPITIPVGDVIPGWTEALQLMKVGSKWQLYIPSDIAYGVNPRPGGSIKPNDALVFDIELLKIERPADLGLPGDGPRL